MALFYSRKFLLLLTLIAGLSVFSYWVMRAEEGSPPDASAELTVSQDTRNLNVQSVDTPSKASSVAPTERAAHSVGIFRGRVIDAVTRKPIREFDLDLSAIQEERSLTQSVRTKDGRFQLKGLRAGDWRVMARARDYQRFELASVRIERDKSTPEIVMPLLRGYTLRGRVYDETSGIGIAAANLSFRESHVHRWDHDFRSRPSFMSETDGSFVMEGLPLGPIIVRVHAQNYSTRELDTVVAEETAPLQIGLSFGGVIAGRLTAADGVTPVMGAVSAFDVENGFGGMIRTGEAGEFYFPNLPAGRYQITGMAGGVQAIREIALEDNERIDDLVLALVKGRSIHGVVTGLRPEEHKLVTIFATQVGAESGPPMTVRLDERGAYRIEGVQPGRVRVAADVQMRRQLARVVDMPADADITVNFEFARGSRLSGRVTRQGKPLAGVHLEPRPAVKQEVFLYGASTSSDGRYTIEDLPPGEYRIFVDSYRSRAIEVSGDTVFDIDIPAAQFAGRVLEADTHAPIVDAQVDIWSADSSASRINLSERTDHLGQFEFVGLEAGVYVWTAYKPGYEMFRVEFSYDTPTETTIDLRRGEGAEIRVRDAMSGKSLRRIQVNEMTPGNSGTALTIRLDERGTGSIPTALAGATLSFVDSGYAPAIVHEWNGQNLDLQLERQQAP